MATPTAAAVGAPISATKYNQIVADLTDSGWIAATLAGAWLNFGGGDQTARYRLIGDRVYLSGVIKSGAAGSVIFTLPAGFRPPAFAYWLAVANAGAAQISIDNTGVVTQVTYIAGGTNALVSLEGISFTVN